MASARSLSWPGGLLAISSVLLAVTCFIAGTSAGAPAARNPIVAIEGTLEHLHEDGPGASRDLYFIQSRSGERLSLHFAGQPPRGILTDHWIRVRGVRVGQTFRQEPGTSVQMLNLDGTTTTVTSTVTSTTSATVLPNTFGAQRTLVILLNFQDNPVQPYTLDDATRA